MYKDSQWYPTSWLAFLPLLWFQVQIAFVEHTGAYARQIYDNNNRSITLGEIRYANTEEWNAHEWSPG